MDQVRFQRHLAEALLVPLLALLGLGLFYVILLHYDYRAHQRLNHIDAIVTSTEQLQGNISNQRAIVRSFEIAPPSNQTANFTALQNQTRTGLASLQKLVATDPEASRLLLQLNDQYQLWVGWAQATLAGNIAPLTPVQNDQRGITLITPVGNTIRSLLAHEHTRRTRQALQISSFKRHTIQAISISAVLIGLLLATFTRKSLLAVSRGYRSVIAELHQSSEELERSRNWFQITLESIGDAVLTCDRDSRITFMNPIAARLTAWNAADAIGRSAHDVIRIFDEHSRKPLENPAAKVALSDSILSVSGQSLLIARDQSKCIIQHNAAPIRNRQGKTTGAVLVFRDVTDQLRTQQALQSSEKLAVAGRLAASIAHEIHNPLDSIANLHYLIDNEDDPQAQREYLALARQELARTIQITRTMLSLYREAENPVVTSLSDLTRGVLLLLDRRVKEQSVSVEETYLGDCAIEGFPAELRQVLTNVLVNAIEAAGPNGRVRVHIEAQPAQELRGSGVLIQISDSGKGIASGASERIFQPFFTTKGAEGTGLGLWVSLGIIQKHGGVIHIFNSKDTSIPGACVEIFLPRSNRAFHTQPAAAQTPTADRIA
ncbi:MAG: two-component system sensor histidine kinase NtrB [Acidobacteriaceae bacterium]